MDQKYIAAGFSEDSKKLINTFIDVDNVGLRFTDFAKVWKEMKFSFVFLGRERSELVFFTEECFNILVSQLTMESDFSYKCGLLFTLYSMYMKQISVPKVKIRLTMDHFKELAYVFQKAESGMHLDVCYIFLYLFSDGAFHFVCYPTPLGPRRNNLGDGTTDRILDPNFLKNSIFKTYLDENYVEQMMAFHDQYELVKTVQQNPDITSLKMVSADVFKETKSVIQKLERKFGTLECDEEFEETDDGENTSSSNSRSAIRQRQFEAATSIPRSRCHRQFVVDEPQSSSNT